MVGSPESPDVKLAAASVAASETEPVVSVNVSVIALTRASKLPATVLAVSPNFSACLAILNVSGPIVQRSPSDAKGSEGGSVYIFGTLSETKGATVSIANLVGELGSPSAYCLIKSL